MIIPSSCHTGSLHKHFLPLTVAGPRPSVASHGKRACDAPGAATEKNGSNPLGKSSGAVDDGPSATLGKGSVAPHAVMTQAESPTHWMPSCPKSSHSQTGNRRRTRSKGDRVSEMGNGEMMQRLKPKHGNSEKFLVY